MFCFQRAAQEILICTLGSELPVYWLVCFIDVEKTGSAVGSRLTRKSTDFWNPMLPGKLVQVSLPSSSSEFL